MNSGQVEHTQQPDIVIVGGGAAGVAAAVGATSNGSNVLLVEKNTYPGGRATASQVGTICGLYLTCNSNEATFVCNGFPRNFAEKILQLSNKAPLKKNGNLFFLPYNIVDFETVCTDYLNNPLIKLIYGAELSDVEINNNSIDSIKINTGSTSLLFQPKCLIDTSGGVLPAKDNTISAIENKSYQAAARSFSVCDLNVDSESTLDLAILRCIKKGLMEFNLTEKYSGLSVIPGSLNNGKALLKYSLPESITSDNITEASLNNSSETAIQELFDFLTQNSSVFSNAKITSISPETGVRTGPRNKGAYVLNEEDVLACNKFNDGIARGSWPIEIWKPGKKVELKYFSDCDYYEIPSGCVKSDSINNLFFAGKNISATENAIASARVIGTCLQTGFAAGVIASDYCNNISIFESIGKIRRLLFSGNP